MESKVRTAVLGIGSSVPEKVLTNADLERMVDTSDEWIVERTGIRERRIAGEGQETSVFALDAAQKALEMAGLAPDQLDLIIAGTVTPDYRFPALATIVQHKLGTRGQAAFDVNAACSGFLYGLTLADQMIRGGQARYALVIGAELLSHITNWEDRHTCVLFGDGAGAAVLGPTEEPDRGILSSKLTADGSTWPMLYMPGNGTKEPLTKENFDQNLHKLHMTGNAVFKMAVTNLINVAEGAMDRAGISADEVECFIPHQANKRIIEAVGKRVGAAKDKIYVNVDRFGNTSTASIPIAWDEVVQKGIVKRGDLLLLAAFGAGASAAALALRW